MILYFQSSDFAQEGAASGSFTLCSIFPYTSLPSITLPLSFTGSALSGTDYVSPPSSITLSPASPSATLSITPIDDNIPEWTETITLTPAGPLEGSGSFKTVSILGNDAHLNLQTGMLHANFDDDNGNGIPDAEDLAPSVREDDLYPITISLPAAPPAKAYLSLELPLGVSNRITIWDSPVKNRELLGGRAGSRCTLSPPPGGQVEVWLEVVHGSQVVDDIVIDFALFEFQAGSPPHFTVDATTLVRTAVGAKIVLETPRNVTLGDHVRAHMIAEGPEAHVTSWERPCGVVFGAYEPVVAASVFVPYSHPDGDTIDFRWMRADDRYQKLRATVTFVNGHTIDAFQTVAVFAPSVQTTRLSLAAPEVGTKPGRASWYLWPQGDPDRGNGGFRWSVRVTVPPGSMVSGQFAFLNIVDRMAESWLNGTTQSKSRLTGRSGLHTGFPYAVGQSARRLAGPFNEEQLGELKIGNHRSETTDFATATQWFWAAAYDTYLMFKSNVEDSNWVPVQHVEWGFATTAVKHNSEAKWSPSPLLPFTNGPRPPVASPATAFPVWDMSWNANQPIDEEMRRGR